MPDPSAVPTSVNFVGALLYDDEGNFVAISSGSILNVTQSYFPVAAKTDTGVTTPLIVAPGSTGLKVAVVGTRNVVGSYFASYGFVAGAASVQNLFSIDNPANSGRSIAIKRFGIDGVANAGTTVAFLYHLGRTFVTSSSGTVQSAQKRATTDQTPVAVCRTGQSSSYQPGSIWVYSPGIVGTLVGSMVPSLTEAVETQLEVNEIILAPNEGLAVKADTNATAWNHFGFVFWQEFV